MAFFLHPCGTDIAVTPACCDEAHEADVDVVQGHMGYSVMTKPSDCDDKAE